jgi:hypothetical protein
MRVTMTKATRVDRQDGGSTMYAAGCTYDVDDGLARNWKDAGRAHPEGEAPESTVPPFPKTLLERKREAGRMPSSEPEPFPKTLLEKKREGAPPPAPEPAPLDDLPPEPDDALVVGSISTLEEGEED